MLRVSESWRRRRTAGRTTGVCGKHYNVTWNLGVLHRDINGGFRSLSRTSSLGTARTRTLPDRAVTWEGAGRGIGKPQPASF
jgi:hypothetical protein